MSAFTRIWYGIFLKAKSVLTGSEPGSLEVLDSDKKLYYHNGDFASPVVTGAHIQTLTFKNIDADQNTITNIDNADIKAGANIAVNKLAPITAQKALQSDASGVITPSSVTSTELSYLSGVTSAIQTQIDTKAANSDLTAHLNDTIDAHDASAISVVPTGDLGSTDVQSALVELQTDIDTAEGNISTLQTDVAAKIPLSQKGTNNGVATLDSGGKVPASQLPNSVMEYQGTWDVSTNTPNLADGIGNPGDVYEVSVAGTRNLGSGSITFRVGDWAVYGADSKWHKSINSNEVTSVNSQTGTVVLTTDNVSEGATNQYFTSARAQTALSSHTSASTGVHGVTGSVVGTSDAQVITNKDFDGGIAANNRRITIPKDTLSNLQALTRKEATLLYATDQGKPYFDNGTTLTAVGSGSGSGGINYITNSDAELDTTGYVTYADTAGVAPVDGTGGIATTTLTRSTSSPLRGTASFLITKDAANRQGEGVSYAFNLDSADVGRNVEVSFDYSTSANYVGGDSSDVRVYLYDVTNSSVIYPNNLYAECIKTASGRYSGIFPLGSGTSYRLCFHIATTSALAYTLKLDNVKAGPVPALAQGAIIEKDKTISLTPSAGFGTVTNTSYWITRRGNRALIRGTFQAGTVAGSTASIALPSNIRIDTTLFGNGTSNQTIGYFNRVGTGASTTATTPATVFYDGSDNANVYLTNTSNTNQMTKVTVSSFVNSSDTITFEFEIPVSSWETNISLASSSTFDISSILANGTQLTGATAPSKLGEYRIIKKSASTNTGTVDTSAPTTLPSSTNGMRIYAVNYATAGTAGSPNRWEIFVGKNKNVNFLFFPSTGKTGQISTDGYEAGSEKGGVDRGYDPTTGIAWVDTMSQRSTITTRVVGITFANGSGVSGSATDCYFTIIVSENALAVGVESPRSEILLTTANGYGSTNTKIRRFSTTQKSQGGAITYTDSAANGASFTINENGLYNIYYVDNFSGGSYVGVSKNSSQLTTNIQSITLSDIVGIFETAAANKTGIVSTTLELKVGDVIRPHTEGVAYAGTAPAMFRITKVSN